MKTTSNTLKIEQMELSTIIKFVLCVLLAGTAWCFMPSQISHVGAEFAVGYRILIGGIALGIFAFIKKDAFPRLTRSTISLILINGIFLYGINYILLYSAIKYIPTGLVSLVVSAMIVPNTILGVLILKNKISMRGVVGGSICLLGLATVFYKDLFAFDLSNTALKGFLLSFSSIFFSAFGTVMGGKLIKKVGSIYWLTSMGMIVGALVDIAFGYYQYQEFKWSMDVQFIFSLLYLSIVITSFVMVIYMEIVYKFGAEKASYIWILVPIIALNMSTLFEGMIWSYEKALGSVIVISGSLIALKRQKNKINKEKINATA